MGLKRDLQNNAKPVDETAEQFLGRIFGLLIGDGCFYPNITVFTKCINAVNKEYNQLPNSFLRIGNKPIPEIQINLKAAICRLSYEEYQQLVRLVAKETKQEPVFLSPSEYATMDAQVARIAHEIIHEPKKESSLDEDVASATTTQEYVNAYLKWSIGDGKRFESRDMYEAAVRQAASRFGEDPDSTLHGCINGMNKNQVKILAAVLGLSRYRFEGFLQMAKIEARMKNVELTCPGKNPLAYDHVLHIVENEIIPALRSNQAPVKTPEPSPVNLPVEPVVIAEAGHHSFSTPIPATAPQPAAPTPSATDSTANEEVIISSIKRSARIPKPKFSTIDQPEFERQFDQLAKHALTHKPHGIGRAIGLAKFLKLLKQRYDLHDSRMLADAIIASNQAAGKTIDHDATDLQRAFFNKAGGAALAEQELFSMSPEQMNEPCSVKGKGFVPPMAEGIAYFAFPCDEARRNTCEQLLKADLFLVPPEVESRRKSENWRAKGTKNPLGEGPAR